MAPFPMFAAIVAAAVAAAVQGAPALEATATAQGDGLQARGVGGVLTAGCMRIRWYDKVYDGGIEPGNFLSEHNEVAGLPPSAGGPVFVPSQATDVATSHILYNPQRRRQGTFIFEGIIALNARRAGKYVFKLTTDMSAHMLIDGKVLIDNGSFHSKQTKTGTITLKAGQQYHMQVWWGNWRSNGEIQVSYCRTGRAMEEAADVEVLRQLSDASGGIDAGDLTDEQLELSDNTRKPFIMRYELNGFFNGDIQKYNVATWRKNAKKGHMPAGWATEWGGVIAISPKDQMEEPWADTTTIYTAQIAARTVGFHLFWVQATATALLYIDDTKVVEVSNAATPTWRMGSIWLEKGAPHQLAVYYGTPTSGSTLKVLWQDVLMSEPAESLTPIMTPHD